MAAICMPKREASEITNPAGTLILGIIISALPQKFIVRIKYISPQRALRTVPGAQ